MADPVQDLATSPWWVVAAGAIPSLASSLWVFWRWSAERRDKRHEGDLTREQRLTQEMDAQRTALSREQAELFDRMRAEVARVQARNLELERDRDRGWDLARYWNRRAHELRHAALNAQTMVMGLIARDPSLAAPTWPDMTILGLEDPK